MENENPLTNNNKFSRDKGLECDCILYNPQYKIAHGQGASKK